jgi:hypothetical protein
LWLLSRLGARARFRMLAFAGIRRLRTCSQAGLEPWHLMITSQKDLALRRTGLIRRARLAGASVASGPVLALILATVVA